MTDYTKRRITMVDTQVRPSDVTKFPIIEAMLSVPREIFVPDAMREVAYVGEHVKLDANRVVLEARDLAKMLEALDVTSNDLVLDIGPAMGYSSAVLAQLAEAVIAVEDNKTWAQDAEQALADAGADNVAIITGPLGEGASKHGPYDVILLQGGVQELPTKLTDQLKEGGRIGAIFIDGALGRFRVGQKHSDGILWRDAFNATAPVLPGYEAMREFAL